MDKKVYSSQTALKKGYMYKDACPCSIKRKTLYEIGVAKVKRRERRNDSRRNRKREYIIH